MVSNSVKVPLLSCTGNPFAEGTVKAFNPLYIPPPGRTGAARQVEVALFTALYDVTGFPRRTELGCDGLLRMLSRGDVPGGRAPFFLIIVGFRANIMAAFMYR